MTYEPTAHPHKVARPRTVFCKDFWSVEEVDALKVMVKDSTASFKTIANLLNVQFGGTRERPHDRTRNAVIGKARRLGLIKENDVKSKKIITVRAKKITLRKLCQSAPGRVPPVVFKPAVLREDDVRAAQNRKASGFGRITHTSAAVAKARLGSLPAIVEEKPLTSVAFLGSSRECCKWPTSDDVRSMEVCGAPSEIGAYCERHARVAYTTMPTRKRNRIYHKREEYVGGPVIKDEDAQWIADHVLDDMPIAIDGDTEPLLIPAFLGVIGDDA
jgi:hypothetical protein